MMLSQLRCLALSSQGLNHSQPFGKGLQGVRKAIEHLGYVQIDTLYVVERAHHHVLWSRVPGYKLDHLNRLVNKKQVFEYWFHAASYLPIRDYRYVLPHMNSIRRGDNRYYKNADKKIMKEILACVKAKGPSRARDMDISKGGSSGSWWSLSAGRRALDMLFMQGDLMVCERNGMEKVYDLTERCLPDSIDMSVPSVPEYASYLFETVRRSHGVFTWKQLLHLKTGQALRKAMRDVVENSIESGLIHAVVDASTETYVDTKALEKIPTGMNQLKVLSPFDNALIHRERLSSLFGFDYRMECYVAKSKRAYGYFCLPIMYDNKFAGRVDCKALRSENTLEVISLHLEDSKINKKLFYPALIEALQSFAVFNQCLELDDSILNY